MIRTTTEKPNRDRVVVKRPTPVHIVSASAATTVLTVEFNQPVVLKRTPPWTTDVAGAVAVSAVMTDPLTMELTFDASIAAATVVNIPYDNVTVRSEKGGFVADSSFPL